MRRNFEFAVVGIAALLGSAACSSGTSSDAFPSALPSTGYGDSGPLALGVDSGSGSDTGPGFASDTGSGSASDTGSGSASDTGSDTGPGSGPGSGPLPDSDSGSTGGGGEDAGGLETDGGEDSGNGAVSSADVQWGSPCIYNFGSSCPFPLGQECGNHQGIPVTFPNGPQLLNATLFAGLDCSPTAFNDNFNDEQNLRGSEIWMFTDDAEVAGVSAGYSTSVIWWVGPLTASGYPPAGAPTTGCINYTIDTAACQ